MAKTTTGRSSGTKKSAAKPRAPRKTAAKKPTANATDTVIDDTAPGEAPVVVSATEARASEPVMADEAALTKDTPPPASNPTAKATTTTTDTTHERAPTSGDGDYVGVPNSPTAEPGEAEFNAAAHVPSDDETTVDGIRYEDVKHPRSEKERMEKREIELGAEMDYAEHRRTYATFMNATKYGTAIVIALLVAMAIGFFVAGSFMGGLVVFIGAALAAVWFLR